MNDFLSDNAALFLNNMNDGETEFIPLLSQEDEERMNNETIPEELAILS